VQIGILVKDLQEAVGKFENLGIGPFDVLEPDYEDRTVHGHPAKFKIRIGLARTGGVQIELLQPLQGETIYEESIKKKGFGLHHLGIRVDDMEQSIREMGAKGFRVIQSGKRPGVKWAYLDTEEETGVILELLEKKQPPS